MGLCVAISTLQNSVAFSGNRAGCLLANQNLLLYVASPTYSLTGWIQLKPLLKLIPCNSESNSRSCKAIIRTASFDHAYSHTLAFSIATTAERALPKPSSLQQSSASHLAPSTSVEQEEDGKPLLLFHRTDANQTKAGLAQALPACMNTLTVERAVLHASNVQN